MSTTTDRLCSACLIGGRHVPATHYETRERRFVFCSGHSLPWDVPLGEVSTAGAVDQVRGRVWPGLGDPQGMMNDE